MSGLARAVLGSGPGRAAMALLLVVLAWNVWLTVQTPWKIDPALAAAVAGGAREVHLLVTLNFPPERFHALVFQKFGRVAQTRDHSVEIRGVRADDVDNIARYYWVKDVSPAP